MKHGYERYILPDWCLTMADYDKWMKRNGHPDPDPKTQLEIEHRMAQVAANKAEQGYIRQEYNSQEQRHSQAVNRCLGNGSRHRSNMIGRNY